jgi:hypothetical protein
VAIGMITNNQIGFVIVTYNNPQQALRLVRTLQKAYENPPIVIHHDISQSPIRPEDFPSDIKFVSPHTKTRWGDISVVTAALRALDLLYATAAPDWFFLLSGADYPVMSSGEVLRELANSAVDALLDYREIGDPRPPENPSLEVFTRPFSLYVARQRYIDLQVRYPVIQPGPRIGANRFWLPIPDWRSPFNAQFKCYFGDHWFAGNSRVADILLNPTEKHMELRRYFRKRLVPEECYYHSVLANSPNLKITRATKRFAVWGNSPHPNLLGLEHLDAIKGSHAYFARKFAPDSAVLDEIDKMLV